MGLFASKMSYLGVDIGTSSIKIVELLNENGRPRLLTYGFTEKKLNEGSLSTTPAVEDVARAIVDVVTKSRAGGKKVITALPNFSVFTSILTMPYLSKKELPAAISWEAKKIIPTPLEDIILDWKVIEEIEPRPEGVPDANAAQSVQSIKRIFSKPHKNLKILLTGANKKLVKRYIDIFHQAGLSLLSLETESFALIRALVGSDKTTTMIIDLGATTSSLVVVDSGVPVLNRSMEIGGLALTRAISTSLNVNLERAEQFKQDLSLDQETADNALPGTVEKAFDPILKEIVFTVNLYQGQHDKKIEKVILTGGTALLGHLSSYLETILQVNTVVGDPWARVIYPVELRPVLDRLGSRFAVAIGLAMRNIE